MTKNQQGSTNEMLQEQSDQANLTQKDGQEVNTVLELDCFQSLGVPSPLMLNRYPKQHQHVSLQAWDSADEYLIQHVAQLSLPESAHIVILNDDFGALTCALSKYAITWQSDSWIAQKACIENLKENQTDDSNIQFIHSLISLTDLKAPKPDLIIIKLPRAHALLEYQLAQIQPLSSDIPVVAVGKVKAVQSSVLKLFEKYLGETKTSLAVKKARLIFSSVNDQSKNKASTTKAYSPTVWHTEQPKLTIHNHANVFSRGQLDIGARLLLQNLPIATDKTVIDLGCGNGVLGLYALQESNVSKMIFTDESSMALNSAQLNVQENLPEKMDQCEFILSNCLEEIPHQRADLVLCNPPFHQQNTVTDHVAWQMFQEAKRALHIGGELRVVANRHLKHHEKLKRLFGGYRVVASNKKFSILSAIKK